MRKQIINDTKQAALSQPQSWLDIEALAVVEITSEADNYPIEAALLPAESAGWRAAGPGPQTIRLLFDRPQQISMIRLHFIERERERTQEYLLRWSDNQGEMFHEIVRQQWNFNPNGATSETEEYKVALAAVTVLELIITPNISGGDAVATLAQLRLA